MKRETIQLLLSIYPSSSLPYNQVLQPSLSNNPLQLARESLNYQAPTRKVETGSHMLRLVQEIVEPPVGQELLLTLSSPPLHSPHPHRDTTYKTATCIRTLREQTSARRPEPHLRTVTFQVFAGPYNFRKRNYKWWRGVKPLDFHIPNFRRLRVTGVGFTSFSIMGIKRDAGGEEGNCGSI